MKWWVCVNGNRKDVLQFEAPSIAHIKSYVYIVGPFDTEPEAQTYADGVEQIPQSFTKFDVVCEHGTAMDVHCCGCHSGFLFDIQTCTCLNP